jgi:Domain of unknown function (DUF4865)
MIAMQYNFALPADYDMTIIDRRIAEKGGFTDQFPGLAFKAYLVARRGEDGAENLYAPFYLWRRDEGLSDFLCGPGFEGVSGAFGWPSVRTWIVWRAALSPEIARATYASRELLTTVAHADLGGLRHRESEEADNEVRAGALVSAIAFEPTTWTRVRFRLWRERPRSGPPGMQTYRVGHLSLPGEA